MAIGRQYTGPLTSILTWSRRKDKTDTALKVTFISLQVVDFILTALAARFGWSELNPIMQGSLDSLSKLAVFKFAVPVLISWFVPGRWLIPAILLLCCILGWNIKELISLAMA
jgi:protein-S-isoprenylcysteine O-methyltransferase Ste14